MSIRKRLGIWGIALVTALTMTGVTMQPAHAGTSCSNNQHYHPTKGQVHYVANSRYIDYGVKKKNWRAYFTSNPNHTWFIGSSYCKI